MSTLDEKLDEGESEKKTIRTQSVRLVDLAARAVRAGAEAVTDTFVDTIRIGTDLVSGVTRCLAENVNSTASGATDVAQKSVDRFFSVLDTARDEDEEEAARTASEATPPPIGRSRSRVHSETRTSPTV